MKKTIALIISSLTLSLASVASAQIVTYTFTGESAVGSFPANIIDGSTVTIDGSSITTFNFTAAGLGLFATPGDTTILVDNVSSYGPSGWTGNLDMLYDGVDIEVTGDSFASAALQSSITGTWSAPDGINTMALLGAAVVGLAAWRPLLRRLT